MVPDTFYLPIMGLAEYDLKNPFLSDAAVESGNKIDTSITIAARFI